MPKAVETPALTANYYNIIRLPVKFQRGSATGVLVILRLPGMTILLRKLHGLYWV